MFLTAFPKVLLLGEGGREAALRHFLVRCDVVQQRDAPVDLSPFDLVVPDERSTLTGVGDACRRQNVPCFGPGGQHAHQIVRQHESKTWVYRHGVPIFTAVKDSSVAGLDVSLHFWCDGHTVQAMPEVLTYAHVFNRDQGARTSGMGAVVQPHQMQPHLIQQVTALAQEVVKEFQLVGVLCAHLKVQDDQWWFLKWQLGFGDPEAQALLPMLEVNLYGRIMCCVTGKLHAASPSPWDTQSTVAVSVTTEEFTKNCFVPHPAPHPVQLHFQVGPDLHVFRPTPRHDVHYLATVVALSPTLRGALEQVYTTLRDALSCVPTHYRTDIGLNVLKLRVAFLEPTTELVRHMTDVPNVFQAVLAVSFNPALHTKIHNTPELNLPSFGLCPTDYDQILNKVLRMHEVDVVVCANWDRGLSPWFVRQWRGALMTVSTENKEKTCVVRLKGVTEPILAQRRVTERDDPWDEAALAVTDALRQCIPRFGFRMVAG
jgi:phosphoribosylamine-glycine ligase